MRGIIGYLVVDQHGKPITNHYDDVLLFTKHEDATSEAQLQSVIKPHSIKRVYRAQTSRKPNKS